MTKTTQERWKAIPGYEGLYEVSYSGLVKTLGRIRSPKSRGASMYPAKIMKQQVDRLGYKRVDLFKNGIRNTYLVHVLVMMAFEPKPQDGLEINHKDGDKQNNFYSNLEWVTKSENVLHSYHVIGRQKANWFKRKVNMLSTYGDFIRCFDSIKDAAEHVGSSKGNITEACRGRYETIKGFKWAYAED